jgi:hypothetical protein
MPFEDPDLVPVDVNDVDDRLSRPDAALGGRLLR